MSVPCRAGTAAFGVATIAMATVAMVACSGGGGDRQFAGYERDPAPSVSGVSLPDGSRGGEPFEFRAAAGGLLVTYFGYTSCPDVCPTTMSDLRTALRGLGDDAARVEVAMATIDPARDTPAVLTAYVQSFVAGAHALSTTEDSELRAAADAFGASYAVTAAAGTDEPEVAHSSFLYAVDDAGTLRLTWPFGVSADDLQGDLEQLLDEVDGS